MSTILRKVLEWLSKNISIRKTRLGKIMSYLKITKGMLTVVTFVS